MTSLRTSSFRAALALAAVLLVALAGCGGDDEASTTETTTKAGFIAAADQICTETGAKISAEAQERFPDGLAPGEGDAIEQFFAEVTIPALKAQYEQIGELTPPEGEEDEVEAIVEAGNAAVAKAEKDPASLAVLTGFKTPFDEVGELQRDFGFEVCGAADPEFED